MVVKLCFSKKVDNERFLKSSVLAKWTNEQSIAPLAKLKKPGTAQVGAISKAQK